MQINPINNFMIRDTPYTNLRIQGSTNEVTIIDGIKLDASYCVQQKTDCIEHMISKKQNMGNRIAFIAEINH